MKTPLILAAVFATSVLLFFAPHHHRKPDSFKAHTLWEIYRQFFGEMPKLFQPRMAFLLLMGVAGLTTAFFPAVLVLMIRGLRPDTTTAVEPWFVIGGFVSTAGVVANGIAMLFSQVSFGFGTSKSPTPTPCFWAILLFQSTAAIASFAIAVSTHCAALAARLVMSY